MPERPRIRDLDGRVAVVTGAASGIGFALCRRLITERASVVMLDVEAKALNEARAKLADAAVEVSARVVDVASAVDVELAAVEAYDRHGAVHVLFNNAGVSVRGGAPIWERSPGEWEWVLGVNVAGVANGLRSFVPRMLAGGQPGHIVNTGSRAGLFSPPGSGAYVASKHAVVSMTEQLHRELQEIDAALGVSVLCPTFARTAGASAERNRPAHLRDRAAAGKSARRDADLEQVFLDGQPSEEIAQITIDAVLNNRFYVLPTERIFDVVTARYEDMAAGRAPRVL